MSCAWLQGAMCQGAGCQVLISRLVKRVPMSLCPQTGNALRCGQNNKTTQHSLEENSHDKQI